jgi:two-component system chemotaxis response regulator CheY
MKNTLLIVEDDEMIILLMKHLFEKNYNVFTASNGFEAMTHLMEGIIPDIIISDLMMEHVTGYEFIRKLYSTSQYRKIPVIVVSSSETGELSKEFPTLQFLNKPFDPVMLSNLVETRNRYKN